MAYTGPIPYEPSAGGTGVANANASTITLGGAFAMSGAHTFTGTVTGATTVTFPTSGTLATTSQLPSITATQYDVLIGGAANAVVSIGPGSAGQYLQSGGNAANPAYSTATLPSTATGTGKILIADGTNWVASTPTYPNTSGTSGKVLISNGTNNVYSTPTFPNVSASSGKFIQSDGTNWIASTPTLPATAGSSGKILISDGTNFTSSTPTYPNSASSTGTILRADGTNWVATTATYPATTTLNSILYSSSASVIGQVPVVIDGVMISNHAAGLPYFLPNSGTPGYVLTANSGAPPSWQAGGGGGGGITTINVDGSGSVTGSTISLFSKSGAAPGCGSSVSFTQYSSGTEIDFYVTDRNSNTLIGEGAGNASLTSTGCTGLGVNSLAGITSGNYNVGIGFGSLTATTMGAFNTCIGSSSGYANITGSNNVTIGYLTLGSTSGSTNVVIGFQSGSGYTTSESGNILILSNGSTGESNVIRINEVSATNCYIGGISGVTTSDVGSTTAVLIDATGNLGTIASSIRYKENISDMNDYSSVIYKLRPVIFNYKSDSKKTVQSGLIAEEVNSIAPQLAVLNKNGEIDSVKYHDLPALLLNEIQKLNKRIADLEGK